MNKTNFSRKIWISSGVILGSIIIAFVAFYYISNDLSAQTTAIAAAHTKDENETAALSNLVTLKESAATAAHYQTAIQDLLPDQYSVVSFDPWLAQIAKKYGITASASFQGSATQAQGGNPGSIVFALQAFGPQGSIAPFLNNVISESSGYLVTLSSFEFATNNNNQETLTAQGILYFR